MVLSTHQARVDAVLELVSHMMRGITPDPKIGVEAEFFCALLARLEAFIRLDIIGEGVEQAQTLVDPHALASKLRLMQARATEQPDSVKLLGLEVFQAFKWLMTPAEHTNLGDWVRSALQRASSEAHAIGSCATHASASGGAGGSKSKAKAKDLNAKDAMSFFG